MTLSTHYADTIVSFCAVGVFIFIHFFGRPTETEKTSARMKSKRRMRYNFSHRAAIAVEWLADEKKMRDWQELHPYGPLNEVERQEYEDLVLCQAGSYMLWRNINDQPVLDGTIDKMFGEIQDWRV